MYPLARHRTRTQGVQSNRWSRRPLDDMRAYDSYQYQALPKNVGGYEHEPVAVEMEDRNPPSAIDPVPSMREAVAMDAWQECAAALKEYDEDKIRSWKEEIDTHLVFAGLFSAILTAFNVESYKLLNSNNQDFNCGAPGLSSAGNPSATLTVNLSLQANLGQNASINATLNSSGSSSLCRFAAPINGLWFSSLICSLAAASISILVKQWLNQYTSGLAGVSPEIARLRQFRYDNLKKWKVAGIMLLLPILLQGALMLFLLGLILFLWALNVKIGAIAIALVSLLLSFILVTAILPTFSSDCSYQSPQAWGVFIVFQALKKPARSLARSLTAYAHQFTTSHADGALRRLRSKIAENVIRRLKRFADKPNTYSWKARERFLIDDKDAILDQHMLVGADATFLDDTFLRKVVQPCLNDMPAAAAVPCYYDIMAHRADRVVSGVIYFEQSGTSRDESLAVLTDITLDTLKKARTDRTSIEHPIRILKTLEPLLVRSLRLTYGHVCRVLFSMLDDPDTTVRHLSFQILYQQLSRNRELAQQYASAGCHDLSAIVTFVSNARTDGDIKHFLDACDLVICLATLPELTLSDGTEVRTHLRDTLLHIQDFFGTPLWKNEPRLLYPISRIAPHLVELKARFPSVIEEALVDVLAEVAEHAKRLNHDGNWEDMVIILETTLGELRGRRQQPSNLSSHSTLNEDRSGMGRRPSLMRTPLGTTLDVS